MVTTKMISLCRVLPDVIAQIDRCEKCLTTEKNLSMHCRWPILPQATCGVIEPFTEAWHPTHLELRSAKLGDHVHEVLHTLERKFDGVGR